MFPMLIRSDLPRALAAHHAQFGDVRAARIIDAERNLILRIQKLWRGVTVRWVQFIEQIQGGRTLEVIRYRERVRRLRRASSYGRVQSSEFILVKNDKLTRIVAMAVGRLFPRDNAI